MRVRPADHAAEHLTGTPAGALAGLLAGCAATTGAAARARLAAGFAPFDIAALADRTDDAVPTLFGVSAALLVELAADAPWERVLASRQPDLPAMGFVATGSGRAVSVPEHLRSVPDRLLGRSTVRPGALAGSLSEGASLVINQIEQTDAGALRSLCDDLAVVFGTSITANCYLSRDGAAGFGTHWDDHDVIVVQVRGRKLWEVFAPAVLSPRAGPVHRDSVGASTWSGILEPGQAIFIPRGWAHRVVGLAELAVHHTIGCNRPTYLDVLDRSLATASPPPEGDALRDWLAASVTDAPAVVDHVLAAHRGDVSPRADSSLGDADWWLAEGTPADLAVCVPTAPAFVSDPAGHEVVLRWARQTVTLTSDEAQWLAAWPPPDSTEARAFARELLVAGLARVVRP